MKKYWLEIIVTLIIVTYIVFIGFFAHETHEMKIDHKCYMMEDKEFYATKICKPYWEMRKNENNN